MSIKIQPIKHVDKSILEKNLTKDMKDFALNLVFS